MRLISLLPQAQWVRKSKGAGYTVGKVYTPFAIPADTDGVLSYEHCVYDDDGDLRYFFSQNFEKKRLWATVMHRFFRLLFRVES